jgi:hypothetical protein
MLVGATLLVVALLTVFALSLADSQRQSRRDIEKRFRDRAQVSAYLTQSIFATSAAQVQQTAASKLGGPTVGQSALARFARAQQNVYARVIDAQGSSLAATPGAPPAQPAAPHVRAALRGRAELSDLRPGPGGRPAVEWALPYRTASGTRVLVAGLDERLIEQFLASFLAKVPNVLGASSLILDSRGGVLGGTGGETLVTPGRPLRDDRLLEALRHGRSSGAYGDGRFFTTSPVPGSRWRVLLSASGNRLYSTINGARRTIPWLIFGAFALASLVGLALLRRVTATTAELERREVSQRHAVEINDNIIQRLVLAKYALDRGATESSQEKLAETLREAQRLVEDLLSEDDVRPGMLRRRGPASTRD